MAFHRAFTGDALQTATRAARRALRLGPQELLRLAASFDGGYANRSAAMAAGSMKHRCHPWIKLFGRNGSDVDCEKHDNSRKNNILTPGLSGYEQAHPEEVFFGQNNLNSKKPG